MKTITASIETTIVLLAALSILCLMGADQQADEAISAQQLAEAQAHARSVAKIDHQERIALDAQGRYLTSFDQIASAGGK